MLRKFREKDNGSIAVEFALIGPVFMALVMGLVEFGMIFFTLTTAQNASWESARQVATGRVLPADVPATVRGKLPGWAQEAANIPTPTLVNGTYRVSVTIPIKNATATNFLALAYGTKTMETGASFQQESN